MSVVTPPGTAALLPASTAGEPALSLRSTGAPTKSGLALIFPVPEAPPWTSLYETVAIPLIPRKIAPLGLP